ncbi:hypothetical protein DFQ28_004331 [Apophysomyces sp. BC1034]|nr:hypothetical protein DFQ30_006527 [Apophysomyces sp. BC1015]KAG0177443.1 hypothetical protein DFQ29_004813 [Apophysomyces sp. BC1021]KAG0188814.1 hypothetical protein DFQ28_004331 [Apophysomyces sp. BC1034]
MSNVQDREGDEEGHPLQNRLKDQDEELPMDLGDLQDIFSFSFVRGRTILNFILAFLWSIGLPILLFHLMRPLIGQVLAMIVAACPPLLIVIGRMIKERALDPLGFVAGVSFLISGLLSIAEPNERIASICESLTALLVSIFCLLSLLPIRFGSFKLRPLVFQLVNQVMPRQEYDEELQRRDEQRLTRRATKQQKLDWLYDNMGRFRTDMRIMTAAWGVMLLAGFLIKVILVVTNIDLSKAQTYGYIVFGLITFVMSCFSWFYTTVVRAHVIKQIRIWKDKQPHEERVMDARSEAIYNANWSVQVASNAFGQVMG